MVELEELLEEDEDGVVEALEDELTLEEPEPPKPGVDELGVPGLVMVSAPQPTRGATPARAAPPERRRRNSRRSSRTEPGKRVRFFIMVGMGADHDV